MKPVGRTLAEFEPLLAAETALLAAARQGGIAALGSRLPARKSAKTRLRAEFLRFLILGGDQKAPVHEYGIHVKGGFIDGELDVSQCKICVPIKFSMCKFDGEIFLRDTEVPSLSFSSSHVREIFADGLIVNSDVYMDEGFRCVGGIRLVGSQIRGDLTLKECEVLNSNGPALCADRSSIGGGIFAEGGRFEGGVTFSDSSSGSISFRETVIRNKRNIALIIDSACVRGNVEIGFGCRVIGQVRLVSAEIGASIVFRNGLFINPGHKAVCLDGVTCNANISFSGKFKAVGGVSLIGAKVRGNVDFSDAKISNRNDFAVSASLAQIHTVFWKNVSIIRGSVSFESTSMSVLTDDWESWKKCDEIVLHGLSYARIAAGPTDARMRIAWLSKQKPEEYGEVFWPQPWEEIARVLREMGHLEDAKQIAVAKQQALRAVGLVGQRPLKGVGRWRRWTNQFLNLVHRLFHDIYGLLSGFGYRPLKTVGWMVLVWFTCAIVYYAAAADGMIGPTNSGVYTNTRYANDERCGDGGQPGRQHWTRCTAMPPEYTPFDPFVFSLDVILPLLDLKQETEWRPIVHSEAGRDLTFGHSVRFLMWFEIFFGWVTSLLLVSVLGRLVQKD